MPNKNILTDSTHSFETPQPISTPRGSYALQELEMRNLRAARWTGTRPPANAPADRAAQMPDTASLLQDLATLAERLTGAAVARVTLRQEAELPALPADPVAFGLTEVCNQAFHSNATQTLFRGATQSHVFYSHALTDKSGTRIGALSVAYCVGTATGRDRLRQLEDCAKLIGHTLETQLENDALHSSFSAAQKRTKRLEREAEIDTLTQVENQCTFERKVAQRIETMLENGARGAFVMLDIDHFKLVNDLYGHSFGDKYLRVIASAITSAFPPPAIVGRMGGDEFGIFIETGPASLTYLETLLSRCRAAVQRGAAMLGKGDLGRVSIGASLFPAQADSFSQLFELADSALYASKHAGRSVNTIFSPNHHEKFNARAIERRFDQAVDARQIEPYFQPIVDSCTGRTNGYEVLARWSDPQRGLLMPDAFASVFKDYRLAETLTRTMFERALLTYKEARLDRRAGPPVTLSVNLTSFDLLNPEFVFDMQLMLNTYGLDWNIITIEVTENVMLDERSGQILRSLQELRTRGATVALDDFGTGYGGLRHLSNWPVDMLKIDRSFISKLTQTPSGGAVAEAILLLASRYQYQVVAEGVETFGQLQALRSLGCPRVQGFLFARPMSASDLMSAPEFYEVGQIQVN